ncbi:MAG: thioredoxin-like domain-containing protein [Mucilaginibacter sp.]
MSKLIKIIFFCHLLTIMSITNALSQSKVEKEVHIGDKVPDIIIHGFINDTAKEVPISNLYKNKLLILDFWATWCASCLNKFPLMDSLQKRYSEQIEIVSIGYQPYITIKKFFTANLQNVPKYFSVTADDKTLSYNLFPHRGLPHVVWIDSSGKVIAITDGENMTTENIKTVLQNHILSVKSKIDQMNFKMNEPFHLRDTSYSGRSLFTNFTAGIGSGINITYETNNPHLIDRIFAYNLSIRQLYWISCFYNKATMNNFSRMILEINDSLKYMQPSKVSSETYKKSKYAKSLDKGDWDRDNLYCYELQIPKPYMDTIAFKDMLTDLNRNLNLNGRFEKRKTMCYILKYKSGKRSHLKESHVSPKIIYHNFGLEQFLQAQNLSTLIDVLNHGIANSQIVNETGIGNSKLFDFDTSDFKLGITPDEVNHMLKKYGLYLVQEERYLPALVISKN